MRILLSGATIINEDQRFRGSLVIENDSIADILTANDKPRGNYDETVDATGCFILPGIIDTHVHFREPGLTAKADLASESRAAAYGGVTTFFDMPNTMPQTTTIEALNDKYMLAARKSHVNYSFFFGATNENVDLFAELNVHRVPGIKLFMGSSTGNMLVDKREQLEKIFRSTPLPLVAHCEDTGLVNRNMARAKLLYGADPDIGYHAQIRSSEVCYTSTCLAVELAQSYGTRLHVAHLSTSRELSLFGRHPNVTAEAVVAHLFFCDEDYMTQGSLIKCNPAIKSRADRDALRAALSDGRITTVGTDHAPHLLEEKRGGCANAMSGMPMIQFSLVSMLELVETGVLSMERLVQLMCHQPACLFEISERGFIRKGYKADLVVVRRKAWTVTESCIQSKCGWSPMTGHEYQWQVMHTFCNGRHIYNNGIFDEDCRGEEIRFRI